jgi:glycosyltransferase involved in cell wall biosynthesis
VLYLINSLGSGGAQRQLLELVRGLDRSRFDPRICTYDPTDFYGASERYRDLPIRVLPKAAKLDARVAMHLGRILTEEAIDLVHPFLLHAGAWAIAASLCAPTVRVVASERSDSKQGLPSWHVLRWLVFPRADVVIANSWRSARDIQSRLGLQPGRVMCVHNGIDAAWFRERPEPDAAVEAAVASLPPDRPRLAWVGSLTAWKDPLCLARALGRLADADRPAVIVAGRAADAAIARAFDDAIARAGLGPLVRRIDAVADVRALYHRVHGLALTSRFEGFPNVVLEAMAAALPVISGDVSDLADIIAPGREGWLFPPGDDEALAGCLRRFARVGRQGRIAIGRRSRAVAETFTVERMVALTEACYDAALAR